jgi:hypothetical protein
MNRPDDEFEDFLSRRKPIFGRASDDPLEPPDELDRIVLHQAREAIRAERPQRIFKGPRWGAPLAVAATLLLAMTVILHVGMPAKPLPRPEVTVQTVSQRIDPAAPAELAAANNSARADAAPARVAPAAAASDSAAPGGFVSEEEADRYAHAPPAAPRAGAIIEDPVPDSRAVVADISAPPSEARRDGAKGARAPVFRRDSKTWLAEIERLRADGNAAQAEAELAEYKRQHRAYAVSPDR